MFIRRYKNGYCLRVFISHFWHPCKYMYVKQTNQKQQMKCNFTYYTMFERFINFGPYSIL